MCAAPGTADDVPPAKKAPAAPLPALQPLAAYCIYPLPPRGAAISNELIDRLRDEEGV